MGNALSTLYKEGGIPRFYRGEVVEVEHVLNPR